jgi:hypothetical protein
MIILSCPICGDGPKVTRQKGKVLVVGCDPLWETGESLESAVELWNQNPEVLAGFLRCGGLD